MFYLEKLLSFDERFVLKTWSNRLNTTLEKICNTSRTEATKEFVINIFALDDLLGEKIPGYNNRTCRYKGQVVSMGDVIKMVFPEHEQKVLYKIMGYKEAIKEGKEIFAKKVEEMKQVKESYTITQPDLFNAFTPTEEYNSNFFDTEIPCEVEEEYDAMKINTKNLSSDDTQCVVCNYTFPDCPYNTLEQCKKEYGVNSLEPSQGFFDTEIPLGRSANEILCEELAQRATKRTETTTEEPPLRLYELSPLIESLMIECEKFAEKNDGVLPEDLLKSIEYLEMDRTKKLTDLALWYKDNLTKITMYETEIKRLSDATKRFKKRNASLVEFMKMSMKYKEKIDDHRFKLNWNISKSCGVTDVEKIPEEFIKTKVEKTPIKTEILKLLKKGKSVDGAELITKENLNIK